MSEDQAGTATDRKRCFVVMGFGVKTDFATGRKLDLDKSYRLLIKPVVEGKGLECIRADELRHSGSIDVPMYQELLTADVVVADLSTANPNALYELGIRHALRPRTTIVISENKLSYPFDLNHVMITGYSHLGDAIDFDEVMRFRQVLGDTIEAVLRDEKTDSPVYTFLSELVPPALGSQRASQAAAQADAALQQVGEAIAQAGPEAGQSAAGTDPSLAMFIGQGEQAIRRNDFPGARASFEDALRLGKGKAECALSHNPYLIQRLALATYKSKQPDEIAALEAAHRLLEELNPDESNDPETVGLAGTIEKRLFDNGRGDEHLSHAIWFYSRGYYLRTTGIMVSISPTCSTFARTRLSIPPSKIASPIWSGPIVSGARFLPCVKKIYDGSRSGRRALPAKRIHSNRSRMHGTGNRSSGASRKAEAHFALGNMQAYETARSLAQAVEHAPWMTETFDSQIRRLSGLLERHASLLDPPWPGADAALVGLRA